MTTSSGALQRRGVQWSAIVVVAVVVGAVVGGFFDFGAWHSNGAFISALVVTSTVLLAVGAGIGWFVTRRRGAGLLAVGGLALFVGTQVGAWVAPKAHDPYWSPGTIAVDLTAPAFGSASGSASCHTETDGAFIVFADPPQTLAGTSVGYELRGAGQDGNRGAIGFALWPEPRSIDSPRWGTDIESEVPPTFDVLDLVRIDGAAAAGSASLVAIPQPSESIDRSAFGGAAPPTISGSVTWTCEPPRGEPTPIDGTWFQ